MDNSLFRTINRFADRTGWAHGAFKANAGYGIVLFAGLLLIAYLDGRHHGDLTAVAGAHYPGDVAAGLALGGLVATTGWYTIVPILRRLAAWNHDDAAAPTGDQHQARVSPHRLIVRAPERSRRLRTGQLQDAGQRADQAVTMILWPQRYSRPVTVPGLPDDCPHPEGDRACEMLTVQATAAAIVRDGPNCPALSPSSGDGSWRG